MIYKCPNCGGALKYDVNIQKMKCEYCISYFEPEQMTIQMENSSGVREEMVAAEEVKVEDAGAEGSEKYIEYNVYCCKSCGGELFVNGLESSTFCAYCGQPTIVFDRVSKELQPQYIVPFTITKKEAESHIREKLKRGFFVPKEIRQFNVEQLRGIYIPYWLCDIDYKDKQSIKGTIGSGKSKKTRYYYRAAECRYKNITLDASSRLNDETSQRLEPFDTTKLVPFNAGYLSGYYADCYDVNKKEIEILATQRAKCLFDEEVRKTVKANDLVTTSYCPRTRLHDMKYVLLPVWFLTFRYQDEPYTFLVNGQTGKVVGAVPYIKNLFWMVWLLMSAVGTIFLTPVVTGLVQSGADLEGRMKLWIGIVGLGVAAFFTGLRKLEKVKESIHLTKSKVMLNFVKERQEGG